MQEHSMMEICFSGTKYSLHAWAEPQAGTPSIWVKWIRPDGSEEQKLCVPTHIAAAMFGALAKFAVAVSLADAEREETP